MNYPVTVCMLRVYLLHIYISLLRMYWPRNAYIQSPYYLFTAYILIIFTCSVVDLQITPAHGPLPTAHCLLPTA